MVRRLAEDLVLAVTFMTRLPVPANWIRQERKLAEAFWAMPIAGFLVGLIGASAALTAQAAGLGSWPSAILGVIAIVVFTGALHDDGLADFCDGIGGGQTPERRLAIMSDSHIGTYGTLSLILSIAVQIALIEDLLSALSPAGLLAAVCTASTAARAAIAVPFALLPPAKPEGLSQVFGQPGPINMLAGVTLAFAIALAVSQWTGIAALAGALVGAALASALAYRFLGGYTGDVFGAAISLSFIMALAAVSITL